MPREATAAAGVLLATAASRWPFASVEGAVLLMWRCFRPGRPGRLEESLGYDDRVAGQDEVSQLDPITMPSDFACDALIS